MSVQCWYHPAILLILAIGSVFTMASADPQFTLVCSSISQCDRRYDYCELSTCHSCIDDCPPETLQNPQRAKYCEKKCPDYILRLTFPTALPTTSDDNREGNEITHPAASDQSSNVPLSVIVSIPIACILLATAVVVGVLVYQKNRYSGSIESDSGSVQSSDQGDKNTSTVVEMDPLIPAVNGEAVTSGGATNDESSGVGGPVMTCTDDDQKSLVHSRQIARPQSQKDLDQLVHPKRRLSQAVAT